MSEPEHGSLTWRKSSLSETGNCVEIAMGHDSVYVRNARDRSGPVLSFLHAEWAAFLAGAHNGEFDLPPTSAVAEGS